MLHERPTNVMAKLCMYVFVFELFYLLPPWNDINCTVCEYKYSANKTHRCDMRQREVRAAVVGRSRAAALVHAEQHIVVTCGYRT